ncbi:MAG: radical SAM protein [Candidatus Roizmanbacteria bacterium]|nr:radical SAM protein [Candidatus Roizmanbacteria bacterium]
MSKEVLVLTTITPKEKYIQLGLYNIKATLLNDLKINKKLKVDIRTFPFKTTHLIQGQRFPLFSQSEIQSIAQAILQNGTMIVGLSCFMWNMEVTLHIAQQIKKLNKSVKIILGGPEASDNVDKILKNSPFIDIIVRGEGEETFLELIQYLVLKKGEIKDIQGISHIKNRKIVHNPERSLMELSKIPSPYLNEHVDLKVKQRFTIETSRGCPFTCTYCLFRLMGANRVRYFPVSKVQEEVSYILDKNPGFLWINDDNFNLNEARAIQILKTVVLHRKDTTVEIFINAAIRPLSSELIDLISRARIRCMIGVQSVNARTLRLINRASNQNVIEANIKNLDKLNIDYCLQFIVGLPEETYKDIENDIDWAFKFKPTNVSFDPLMILKNTSLYFETKKFAIVYSKIPPYVVYKTGTISRKDMEKLGRLLRTQYLLFEVGLLRQSLRYINDTYHLSYSTIYKDWMYWNKVFIPNKNYLKALQRDFISFLIEKYKLQIDKNLIQETLNIDLHNLLFRQKRIKNDA